MLSDATLTEMGKMPKRDRWAYPHMEQTIRLLITEVRRLQKPYYGHLPKTGLCSCGCFEEDADAT